MKRIGITYFCLTLLVVSCDEMQKVCKEEEYTSAIVYDFPDSLKAGESQPVNVKYILDNSCGSFVEFEEELAGKTMEVKIKLLYEGCSCDLEFREDSNFYDLKQDSAGTYTYKFFLTDSDYDTYKLKVY